MKRDFPTPAQILEELADKTAAHIERLAPVAFDGAYREMTRYHRFLLALSASRAPDGAPFSFAELAGDAWLAPHRDWIRQYRRLFERAADRIPDDDHFITSLAYIPSRLLPNPSDPQLPPNIVKVILDLVPMMMHRLEAWVTKRTTIQAPRQTAAEPRLALAGSDAKAYANVLPELVGAWESLLGRVPSMYGWPERNDHNDVNRWGAFRASWPFLWQHLSNTAYCLAVAVWNEDNTGATMFREALVRWPQPLEHLLDGQVELRHRRLLFPSMLNLDWQEVRERAAPLVYDYMPAPTPAQLFASILHSAHDDVLLLTATLLLFWTIQEKQASDIAGRTAGSLLRKDGGDENHGVWAHRNLSFRTLFLDLLRLKMAGERFADNSYAAELESLVMSLDNMTERSVVPGRIFTPSTLHSRGDLLLSTIAILATVIPDNGDDGFGERMAELARDEELLPAGDRSLRNVVHELGRYRSALEHPLPQISRGVALLAPGRDVDLAIGRLGEIVRSAETVIENERLRRLRARPVDPVKLERIRSGIETALLNEPAEAPFFKDVQVGRATRGEAAEWRDLIFNGIEKAQFTEPPMESPSSSLDDMFVSGSRELAGRNAWNSFCQRPRVKHAASARAEDEAFWREIAPLVSLVGADPVLVVSNAAEGRVLQRFLYGSAADRPNLTIERRSRGQGNGSYIATVEGVDVFGAGFTPGVAWLFSARTLRSVRYAEIEQTGRYVDVSFDPGGEVKGTLRARVRQVLEWGDTPTFEIRSPDHPDESEADDEL